MPFLNLKVPFFGSSPPPFFSAVAAPSYSCHFNVVVKTQVTSMFVFNVRDLVRGANSTGEQSEDVEQLGSHVSVAMETYRFLTNLFVVYIYFTAGLFQ